MNCEVKTYINKKGLKTDYAVFGNGEKVFVIIPGLSIKPVTESAEEVAKAYELFAKDYTVYLFDRSRPVNDGVTVEDMAEQLYEALASLNIKGAYFFGASQGGMILQSLMINHPETVKKAVLGSTASRADSNIKTKIDCWASLARAGDAEKLHLKFFGDVYSEELISALGDSIYSLIPECSAEELNTFCSLAKACKEFNVYDRLNEISCPVLVIGSEKDKIMSKERQSEIAEKVGGELFMYPSFGHAVYDEAPDYKQKLLDFFEK